MRKRALKYVGYYDSHANESQRRTYSLAASTKMDYIVECLNRIGHEVQVVSASYTRNSRGYRGGVTQLEGRNTLRLFPTPPWGGRLRRAISVMWARAALLLWLIANTRYGEHVLVYHSLGYAKEVALARRIRGFRLVLEVEELYSDITGSAGDRRMEDLVFGAADSYILPAEALNAIVNPRSRPHAVVHGTYRVEADLKQSFNDGRIHIVYAGTFDSRKGGAAMAIGAARFLDSRHHVHIIGSGTASDTDSVLSMIDEVSRQSDCRITFDGSLSGTNYASLVQSCDIGLSTQMSSARFSATSFPSKILSYMSNGLRVVSSRVPVVEESGVGDLVYYYDVDDPQQVAEAILNIDLSQHYDSRARLRALDASFTEDLSRLMA